jgi:hypothetical protein
MSRILAAIPASCIVDLNWLLSVGVRNDAGERA